MRLQKNIMPSSFSVSLNSPQNARQIFFKKSRSATTSTNPSTSSSENTINPNATNQTSRNRSMMTVASAKPMPLFILRPV